MVVAVSAKTPAPLLPANNSAQGMRLWRNTTCRTEKSTPTGGENSLCHNIQPRAKMLTKWLSRSLSLSLAFCDESGTTVTFWLRPAVLFWLQRIHLWSLAAKFIVIKSRDCMRSRYSNQNSKYTRLTTTDLHKVFGAVCSRKCWNTRSDLANCWLASYSREICYEATSHHQKMWWVKQMTLQQSKQRSMLNLEALLNTPPTEITLLPTNCNII